MELCDSTLAHCDCMHPKGHERFGPHECSCGGAWDNDGKVCRYPDQPLAEEIFATLGVSADSLPGAWSWTSEGWVSRD